MSKREKQVLNTFEKTLPCMTDMEIARLIGYGEGLAAREDRKEESDTIRTALAGGPDAE